jgi:transcriptional regulator with XRE-family HTH domain
MKPQDFGERITALREARKMTQAQLARAAGLAPAALSRLLSGERGLRMDQAAALARALGVSVVELTENTTVEGIVNEWVPRTEYERADKARADVERELEAARTEALARAAEAGVLRGSVQSLSSLAADLESELATLRAEAGRAEQLSQANAHLTSQVHHLRAQVAGLEAQAAHLQEETTNAITLADQNFRAWEAARSRVASLKEDLAKAKSNTVGVAALAALAGAMLASPARTISSARRRS